MLMSQHAAVPEIFGRLSVQKSATANHIYPRLHVHMHDRKVFVQLTRISLLLHAQEHLLYILQPYMHAFSHHALGTLLYCWSQTAASETSSQQVLASDSDLVIILLISTATGTYMWIKNGDNVETKNLWPYFSLGSEVYLFIYALHVRSILSLFFPFFLNNNFVFFSIYSYWWSTNSSDFSEIGYTVFKI